MEDLFKNVKKNVKNIANFADESLNRGMSMLDDIEDKKQKEFLRQSFLLARKGKLDLNLFNKKIKEFTDKK